VSGSDAPRVSAQKAASLRRIGRASQDATTVAQTQKSNDVRPIKRASFARRIGALGYEALLLVAMAFVAGFAFLPFVSPGGDSHRTLSVPPLFARTLMFCALVAGAAIYYTWCWSDGRRTLPQKTWRLRLVDRHGKSLTRRRALIRYAGVWIGPAVALAGFAAFDPLGFGRNALAFAALNYCWVIADPDRQFLHDRIAGTVVVQDG
jgi:uncharacterized RDD family membrane protein YckC